VGGDISDVATLADGFQPTGTIVFSLWDNPTCSGTPVTTKSVDVDHGNGDYSSGSFTTTAAGTYHWTADYSGDGNNTDAHEGCGVAAETVEVAKAAPSIATHASAAVTVGDGGSLTDTATLSGGVGPTGSIVFKLYDTADCSSTALFTSTVNVDKGNGDYTSQAYVPTAATTYYWTATYSGDDNNTATTEHCNQPNESVAVAKASPAIKTKASDSIVVDGQTQISDTATLSGGFNAQGTIAFALFSNNDCAGEPLFTSTATVDGNGNYASGGYTPTAAGTYYWAAHYSGDGNNAEASESCNAEGESVAVRKASPAVTTVASAGVQTGGSVSDTASLTGGFHPNGSIAFALYDNANCSGTAVFTSTVAANGNGSYTSGSFTPTAAGTYYWTATFTPSASDGNNNPATEPCGSANESVTVTSPPPPPAPPAPPVTPTPPPPPPVIDLQITKTDSPDPDLIGKTLRYRIVVKNNGPDTAHNVQMSDPLPAQVTFSSVATTQGTCTGGQLVSCQLGTLAPNASVTITILVKPRQTGVVTNTATTVGSEAESNTANNTASTTTLVTAPFKPPVVNACYAVAVTPHQLTAGKRSTLVLRVKTNGKPAKGARVLVTGPGVRKLSGPTNAQGIVRVTVKPAKPGILRFQPIAHKGCSAPRIGVIGAFTPPVTG
jgi:uncharacterized repeat protein (TIGR01451 family)